MNTLIRPMSEADVESLHAINMLAFEPIFASFANEMEDTVYDFIFPDWRKIQTGTLQDCLDDDKKTVWVADTDGIITGFVVTTLNHTDKIGEIYLLAVHPDYQNDGIGTRLNTFALDLFVKEGMELAEVGTGGDPGHAPARRSYEKAGFKGFPQVRYYKKL